MTPPTPLRHLVLVFGDQLNHDSAAFDGFDPALDAVWMAEVQEEATSVWSHKQRLVLFFSAMRHFRTELRHRGRTVHYHALTPDPAQDRGTSFLVVLRQDIARLQPAGLLLVLPGDYRLSTALTRFARDLGLPLTLCPDRHFYTTLEDFAAFAQGRTDLRLENFYRRQRRRFQVLLTPQGQPLGGRWNFDTDNRRTFGRAGPGSLPPPRGFPPDPLTREVMDLVAARFPHHPGSLERFNLPVTAAAARLMLDDFIAHRLAPFGPFQDAMWTGQPFLYHSRLSAPLNLKLLSPQECVHAAKNAYNAGAAPLASVEGFIRQVLGWREYIRGLYWHFMPGYQEMNYLDHHLPLPAFYWHGGVEMVCLRQTLAHVLTYGYSHHIHRLMVAGLFALLLGVHPYRFHEWHLALYLDAVDWVSLPNTLGMSQFADGGIVGTKPYCATGRYLHRMSNFCAACPFDPALAVGDAACPFTTLYWDFLDRHYDRLKTNYRLLYQLRHLESKRRHPADLAAIRRQAMVLKERFSS